MFERARSRALLEVCACLKQNKVVLAACGITFQTSQQTQMYQEMEPRKFHAGDFILRQGNSFGPYAFVIISGQVALISSNPDTKGLIR